MAATGTYGGQGDFADLMELRAALDEQLDAKRNAGFQLAENERAYKVAKAAAELRLRDQGMPVTLIRDLIQGDPDIAELRLARDCAQVTYDTCGEVINAIKLSIRTVNDQINREWHAVPATSY